jgi:hypothetical protein
MLKYKFEFGEKMGGLLKIRTMLDFNWSRSLGIGLQIFFRAF